VQIPEMRKDSQWSTVDELSQLISPTSVALSNHTWLCSWLYASSEVNAISIWIYYAHKNKELKLQDPDQNASNLHCHLEPAHPAPKKLYFGFVMEHLQRIW
jgi:hypothetical protein